MELPIGSNFFRTLAVQFLLPTMRTFIVASLLLMAIVARSQTGFNGPMPGYTSHMEVAIWLQCHGQCTAQLEYWPVNDPKDVRRTAELRSDAATAHVLKFFPAPLQHGTTYGYRLLIDGRPVTTPDQLQFKAQPIWRYRTDPPDFTIALGSCTYINEPDHDRPGDPYGGEYWIFDAIAGKKPDLMLWLGDNVYLREPDFSRTGFLHRYTHTRSAPELQKLLRSTHHYAIWDDHDFGPNDADASFEHADLAKEMFGLFWANPTVGVPGVEGITTHFSHGDIDFFLLDDRSFRVPGYMKTVEPQLLGKAQMDWLIQALKFSTSPFKMVVVGNQVLNPTAVYENYSTIPKEREELLRRIEDEGIKGVVFLTGDRHYAELTELMLKDGRVLRDFTVSPLTSGVMKREEENPLRVEGTKVQQRNFGTISFAGKRHERVMTLRLFNSNGEILWEKAVGEEM